MLWYMKKRLTPSPMAIAQVRKAWAISTLAHSTTPQPHRLSIQLKAVLRCLRVQRYYSVQDLSQAKNLSVGTAIKPVQALHSALHKITFLQQPREIITQSLKLLLIRLLLPVAYACCSLQLIQIIIFMLGI